MTWDAESPVTIETDPILLRSILLNLAQNAVEYAPRGGSIHVACAIDAGRFAVSVSNTVDQLTAKDVPRLFDRFWRGDAARSGTEHSGLGLSLARAFARTLQCELTATLDESCLTLGLSGPATTQAAAKT